MYVHCNSWRLRMRSTCNICASHHGDRLSNVTDAFFSNFFSLKKAYKNQYM